jgi:hypothetical protein
VARLPESGSLLWQVLNAVVDMCMLTAMNFKAKKYNPPNSQSSAWLQANTSDTYVLQLWTGTPETL